MKKKYELYEIVKAADSGKLYEARIIKIQELGEVTKYFIHYNGWAKKYDTWIDDDLIAKLNDSKAVEKLETHAKAVWVPEAKKSKTGDLRIGKTKQVKVVDDSKTQSSEGDETTKTPASSSSSQKNEEVSLDRKKIRKALLMIDVAEQEDCLFASRIEIPFNLKTHLVDEWSLVTKEPKKLLRLPKETSVNVRAVMEDFLELKAHKLGEQDPVVSVIPCPSFFLFIL